MAAPDALSRVQPPCSYRPVEPHTYSNETLYSLGTHHVVADKAFGEKTAKWFLEDMVRRSQEVSNFFGVSFPPQNHLVLRLAPSGSWRGCGHMLASACVWRSGEVILEFMPEVISKLDDSVGDPKKFGDFTLVHELGHALRFGVAQTWRGLEEGLANYTERRLQEKQWLSGQPAQLLMSAEIVLGRTIVLPGGTMSLAFEQHDSFNEQGEVVVEYDTAPSPGNPGRASRWTIPVGQYTDLPFASPDIILRLSHITASQFSLEVFQRPVSSQTGSTRYLDYMGEDWICDSEGYYRAGRILTEMGPIHIVSGVNFKTLYPKHGSVPDEAYYWQHGNSEAETCFWDLIQQRGGDAAIRGIVQSMVTFSKDHQDAAAPFPFFETARQKAGMSEAEARRLFTTFSAPTADEKYPIGGICWP